MVEEGAPDGWAAVGETRRGNEDGDVSSGTLMSRNAAPKYKCRQEVYLYKACYVGDTMLLLGGRMRLQCANPLRR